MKGLTVLGSYIAYEPLGSRCFGKWSYNLSAGFDTTLGTAWSLFMARVGAEEKMVGYFKNLAI